MGSCGEVLVVRVKTLKAKLRAWLIDLVREAIRIERAASQPVRTGANVADAATSSLKSQRQPTPLVHLEPSFEQMQADAIKAQEKYYEPKN